MRVCVLIAITPDIHITTSTTEIHVATNAYVRSKHASILQWCKLILCSKDVGLVVRPSIHLVGLSVRFIFPLGQSNEVSAWKHDTLIVQWELLFKYMYKELFCISLTFRLWTPVALRPLSCTKTVQRIWPLPPKPNDTTALTLAISLQWANLVKMYYISF